MHLEVASRRRSPGIGLTPLIDVVFILLVFFMLATRFSVLQEEPMQLRSAGAAGATEEVARLRITGAGQVMVGEQSHTLESLPDWLQANADTRLVVIPGDDVALQSTVDVLRVIEAAGHEALDVALLGQEGERP